MLIHNALVIKMIKKIRRIKEESIYHSDSFISAIDHQLSRFYWTVTFKVITVDEADHLLTIPFLVVANQILNFQ